MGPFEEEEEGIGITSVVVKVKGEESPATPGSLEGDKARWYVGDPFGGRTPWPDPEKALGS